MTTTRDQLLSNIQTLSQKRDQSLQDYVKYNDFVFKYQTMLDQYDMIPVDNRQTAENLVSLLTSAYTEKDTEIKQLLSVQQQVQATLPPQQVQTQV